LGDRAAGGPCDETELLGALAEEVTLVGGGPTCGESDGSVGSVRSDSTAFVSGGAAVCAVADDLGDLTTAHAETTNEPNFDENISRLEGQDSNEVTADSGEVSRLDTGKTNPFFDGSERAGGSVELTVDIPDVAREMAAGCWPDGVTDKTIGVGGFRGAIAQTGGPHGEVRRSTHPTALVAAAVAGSRSDGLDGLVRSLAVAGVGESSEDGSAMGPVAGPLDSGGETRSTGACAIAEDSGDLTTAHTITTNEPKFDENPSRVQEHIYNEVTADSDEVSGLDNGQSKPDLDPPRADLRVDEAANLAVGIEDFGAAAATWGCRPGPDLARPDGEYSPGGGVAGDCPSGGCDVIAPASQAAVLTHPP
jgi:hypothetical protein